MKRMVTISLFLLLVASACGKENGHEESRLPLGEQKQLPNGDRQEVTASVTELPTFLDEQSEDMQLIYQAAAQATDVIEWMPCYCGCGDSAGHTSNKNCFVDEIREDGSVVWDDHSTRCAVCLETAIESIQRTQAGETLQEIRKTIDERYKEGYAEPTPTPMPA